MAIAEQHCIPKVLKMCLLLNKRLSKIKYQPEKTKKKYAFGSTPLKISTFVYPVTIKEPYTKALKEQTNKTDFFRFFNLIKGKISHFNTFAQT